MSFAPDVDSFAFAPEHAAEIETNPGQIPPKPVSNRR